MSDASAFEVQEDATTEIEIYDNTGAGTGIYITVYSQDSGVASSLRRKMLDRRLGRMQRRGGKAALRADEIEAEAMELRVACVKAWRDLKWKGVELECDDDNKRMIFTKAPLIRQQVDEAIADASLFMSG
jgi:hypothetical protein